MKSLPFAVILLALVAGSLAAQEPTPEPEYDPIHPNKLLAVLPKDDKEFRADKPKAELNGELASRNTVVSRVYTQRVVEDDLDEEAPKPTITVRIIDASTNRGFMPMYNRIAETGQSGKSGTANALSLDGTPAIQTYREGDKVGVLSAFVGERFLVQIAVKGVEQKTMMQWWQKIDSKKLEALAVRPTPTPTPQATPTQTQTQVPGTEVPAKTP